MPRQRREETAQRWASRFAQFENSNLSVGFSTFYFLLSTFYFLLSTIHSLIICIQCLVEINQRLAGLSQLLANGLVFLLRFGFPPNDCWLPAISVRGLDGIYEFKQQEFFAESQVCVILCLRFSVLLGRSGAAMLTGKSTIPAHGQHKRRAKPNATQVPSG